MENSIDYTSGRPATAAVSGLSILQQQLAAAAAPPQPALSTKTVSVWQNVLSTTGRVLGWIRIAPYG